MARRLCEKCKEPFQPNGSELDGIGWDLEALGQGLGDGDSLEDHPTFYGPVGCGACGKTGFHGRFAIHEVLTVTEEIERLIVERGHSEDLKKMAIAQGMLTLRQAGLAQVRAGLTSIEEVLRVVA
jgi:type IV pilus assembly protein PilB